jgi:predicted SnoaL-like aldol condensation-catalyzing enzyme
MYPRSVSSTPVTSRRSVSGLPTTFNTAHIEPGRDGLFNHIKAAPPSLKYESGVILAEGDYVIVHGRFSNIGLPVNWIAADVVRLEDGILVEHWDVIQHEATEQQSKSENPMFGDSFPK